MVSVFLLGSQLTTSGGSFICVKSNPPRGGGEARVGAKVTSSLARDKGAAEARLVSGKGRLGGAMQNWPPTYLRLSSVSSRWLFCSFKFFYSAPNVSFISSSTRTANQQVWGDFQVCSEELTVVGPLEKMNDRLSTCEEWSHYLGINFGRGFLRASWDLRLFQSSFSKVIFKCVDLFVFLLSQSVRRLEMYSFVWKSLCWLLIFKKTVIIKKWF